VLPLLFVLVEYYHKPRSPPSNCCIYIHTLLLREFRQLLPLRPRLRLLLHRPLVRRISDSALAEDCKVRLNGTTDVKIGRECGSEKGMKGREGKGIVGDVGWEMLRRVNKAMSLVREEKGPCVGWRGGHVIEEMSEQDEH